MVRLGLESFSYQYHLENLDAPKDIFWFLEKSISLGFHGCQINSRYLSGWDESLIRSIGKYCADNNIYLELGSAGYDYRQISDRLNLSGEIGARVLRTFIITGNEKLVQSQKKEFFEDVVETLRMLADVAEQNGVILAIENNEDLTSSEIALILSKVESPYVGACVDTGNALPLWEDPVDCVKNLAPYLVSTHLKDWKHWWDKGVSQRAGTPLGRGDVRIAEIYPLLRRANPDMPINLQIITTPVDGCVEPEWEERNVLESIDYVKALEAEYASDPLILTDT